MKKKYVKPSCQKIRLETEGMIAGSPGSIGKLDEDTGSSSAQDSNKKHSIWNNDPWSALDE